MAVPISYSINRGAEKAKTEAAIELFQELKAKGIDIPSEAIIPWVVKKVGSTVVGIKTHGTQVAPTQLTDPFGNRRRRGPTLEIYGEGSGVIIDPEGYILTNYHVVGSADQISVALSDGREINHVDLIGYDQATDLAVLKIDEKDLAAMEWGNSDSIEVGDAVLAIGNPFGLAHTVTQGIISAKERYRPIPDSSMIQEFLQTDAAINPGNSGGPLVNTRGELVGINTAIYGETYQGIGFAIPSTFAQKIYERIRKTKGSVLYGFLGIEMEPLSDFHAEKNGIESGKGVVVKTVVSGSPANQADLQEKDIILKWGDTEVSSQKQLTHEIILTPPGTEMIITIVREGEKMEKTVVVAEKRLRR
jgi:S1-C subfamily serine protease